MRLSQIEDNFSTSASSLSVLEDEYSSHHDYAEESEYLLMDNESESSLRENVEFLHKRENSCPCVNNVIYYQCIIESIQNWECKKKFP